MTGLPILLCAVCVAALLVAEARGSRRGVWIAKPLASACFLWAAVAWGALASSYGRTVLAGLALCAAGDVALIPRGRPRAFLIGIAAFLAGHVAFTLAFARLGGSFSPAAAGLAVAVLVVPAGLLLRWLWPHLGPDWRGPVLAYLAVISAMVACAVGAVAGGAVPRLAAGAIGFAISDVSVARDRFVASGLANAAWGLPLYFGAQLLIASTV